jgi:hypothetical protein
VYVLAILIALVSDVASFVLIAAVAVYYILERTPSSAGQDDSAGDQPVA